MVFLCTGVIDVLKNDPSVLPRLTIISVAGLGGIIAGYKGDVCGKMCLETDIMYFSFDFFA